MNAAILPEAEPVFCADVAAWEAWLEEHGSSEDSVWLAIGKKALDGPSVTYLEAVDAALCFGWIDGIKRRWDEFYSIQRFTPRRARSIWSERNRDRVAELTEEGRMRPAGLAEVERARADGRLDAAYARQSEAEPQDDLLAALAESPAAAEAFAALDRVNRFAIIFRVGNVKRADTRARKIAEFVDMLARGDRLYPTPARTERSAGSKAAADRPDGSGEG